MDKTAVNLIGETFGRLTVIERADDYIRPSNGRHDRQWRCKCSCQNQTIVIVRESHLKEKNGTRSCGCIQKEKASQRMKQVVPILNKDKHITNVYDYSQPYGIGYCHNTNAPFYFDWEDFDLIKDYCWSEYVDDTGYHTLQTKDYKNNGKIIRMHYLLGYKYGDHKDRNPLNNQKSNLRECTATQNAQNHTISKSNSSGYIGVCWNKTDCKWMSYITVNYQRITLGLFNKKEDAIIARLQAELEYFGSEFAPQRHLFKQYMIGEQ